MAYIASPEEINQRTKMNLIQAGAGLLGIGLMSPIGRYTVIPVAATAAKTAWWGAKVAGKTALSAGGAGVGMAPSVLNLAGRVAYNTTAGALWAGKQMASIGVGAAGLGVGLGKTFLAHPTAISIGALGAAGVLGAATSFIDQEDNPRYGVEASNMTDVMGGTTRNIMNSMNAQGDIVLGAHRGR